MVQPLIESIDAGYLKTMKELDEWMVDGVKKGKLELKRRQKELMKWLEESEEIKSSESPEMD